MSITTVAVDKHLSNSASTGFTTSTAAFSISTWISGTWNSGTISMVGLYGPAGTPTSAVQIGSRGDGLVSCWTWGGGLLLASAGTVTNSTWHHIVYTFDGTTHQLYVDGVLSNTSTSAQIAAQFAYIYVNGYPTGVANEAAVYSVDSYAYYSRVLSANEVLTQFSLRGARHDIVNSLIAAYEFDELSDGSTVSQITDLTGNGNHLTVTGSGAGNITYAYAGTVAGSNLQMVQ